MRPQGLPLVVIVGPTASGKTSTAIELAESLGGEIICADSRTVYAGMDIGTAKPTPEERLRVPHWGLDLVEPGERFTAADFKRYAIDKINDIRARDKLPLLVGGTGLYIDGVVFDYQFGQDADVARRTVLEQLTIEQLRLFCTDNNILLPKDCHNKRRIIRVIEQGGEIVQREDRPIHPIIMVGIATQKNELRVRIRARSEQLLTNDVVEEAIM